MTFYFKWEGTVEGQSNLFLKRAEKLLAEFPGPGLRHLDVWSGHQTLSHKHTYNGAACQPPPLILPMLLASFLHYLCHGFQQMFDVPKLSVVPSEHSFNTVHQILNGFTYGLYLLFPFSLHSPLVGSILRQLLVGRHEPFRATNGVLKIAALKQRKVWIRVNWLDLFARAITVQSPPHPHF